MHWRLVQDILFITACLPFLNFSCNFHPPSRNCFTIGSYVYLELHHLTCISRAIHKFNFIIKFKKWLNGGVYEQCWRRIQKTFHIWGRSLMKCLCSGKIRGWALCLRMYPRRIIEIKKWPISAMKKSAQNSKCPAKVDHIFYSNDMVQKINQLLKLVEGKLMIRN